MIKLRQTATIGISSTYARMIEENKIKHYYVSHAKALTETKTAEEMIAEYVKKETGEDVVFETIKVNNAYGVGIDAVQLTKDVLEDLPKVKKQLEKREVRSALYQYNRRSEWYKYLFNPIAIPYNWIVGKINSKWADHQWKKLGGIPTDRFEYLNALSKIKYIPYLPVAGCFRYVTPCHYLAVTFDESNRAEAVNALQKDLKILGDKKLIIGHLAMPFQIQLADTVGSGELSYVLACFLFVDGLKLRKLVGKANYDAVQCNKLSLNLLLGLKTEAFEGGLSEVDFRKKYEIETVNIFEHERQEHWDAYVENWEEQQEAIKKRAKRTAESHKKLAERSKTVYTDEELEALISDVETELNKPVNADAPTLISDKKE